MNALCSVHFASATNKINVVGELTFVTVDQVLTQTATAFAECAELNIDLSAVTRSDSAGLLILLDWMRLAKTTKKQIIFYNVPDQLLAIAHASSVDELLPLAK